MDKKPLIGVSILAVVLLVLGSLNNVVGYESVKSTTVTDSPLFQTRTQRATYQQQNDITAQYLGRGNRNLLSFPNRDDTTQSSEIVIEIINKMDDKTCERFTELCLQRVKQDASLQDITPSSIIKTLHFLKTNSAAIVHSITKRNNQIATAGGVLTLCGIWLPGCIPFLVFYVIVSIIWSIVKQIIFTYKNLCTDMEKIQFLPEE